MDSPHSLSRREFFRCSAAATAATAAAAGAVLSPTAAAAEPETAEEINKPMPRRKLGKTGVDVTILSLGAAFAPDARFLSVCHQTGIRYLDTAKSYAHGASERRIGEWLKKTDNRKDYFVVTKDSVDAPEKLEASINERLEVLQTDYLDLFFLHGLGDGDHGGGQTERLTGAEWRKAVEALRKSNKVKHFGFSTHAESLEVRSALLETAAKDSWVEAIMVAADPTLVRDDARFNKALDACHKADVGLISMKECRGGPGNIEKVFPEFEAKGLNAYTAVLTAMWTDERFASVCSHMDTLEKLKDNTTACRNFKPLNSDELSRVDEMLRGASRQYCSGCTGRCREAAKTEADLNRIARYVSYAEEEGRVYEARELLRNMPAATRNWSQADLAAASKACRTNLDFAAILKRAEQLLA